MEILKGVFQKKCSMFKVGGVYSKEVHLYGKVDKRS